MTTTAISGATGKHELVRSACRLVLARAAVSFRGAATRPHRFRGWGYRAGAAAAVGAAGGVSETHQCRVGPTARAVARNSPLFTPPPPPVPQRHIRSAVHTCCTARARASRRCGRGPIFLIFEFFIGSVIIAAAAATRSVFS